MKKHIFFFIIIIFFSGIQLFAQTPSWMWAKSAGGIQDDEGNAITADAAGNIYAAGYFTSPAITFGNVTLTNSDSAGNTLNAYIVKYSPLGNVIWARTINNNGSGYANGITTDSHSNVYVTGGYYSDTLYFGVSTLIDFGGDDVFVAKFDSSGNALWAQGAGGSAADYGNSVATDTSGNIFITGTYTSSIITFDTITIRNNGSGCSADDIFTAKYSPA
ncbi:MAG: SBBP repeat-containing protein, partial [Bacteroidales bacterium]